MEGDFTTACNEHMNALFRYCYFKISDREMAKDLVQETYMRTWNCLVKGQKIQNIRAFFYRILNNLIIDEYRSKGSMKKSVSLDKLAETGFDPSFDDTEKMENKIDGEKAVKLLQKIPETYRKIISMRYLRDMTLEEMSEELNESKNSITVKAYRGMKKLKTFLNHA